MQGPPILCLGEILIDLIGQPPGPAKAVTSFVPRVGGAPANVAVGLARLGHSVAFLGALAADDPFAATLNARLETEGVDTQYLRHVTDAQTRLAVVTGPPDARVFTFYGHPPADSLLRAEDVIRALDPGASALYLSSIPLSAEPARHAARAAVESAKAAGIPICFDPNPRPQVWAALGEAQEDCFAILGAADLVKVSTHDLCVFALSRDAFLEQTSQARLRVISDGDRGCEYWIADQYGRQAAFPVTPVDETGAGDAFMAALIARGVETGFRYRPEDIAFATAAGALTTTQLGAMDALPTRAAIEAFLHAHS